MGEDYYFDLLEQSKNSPVAAGVLAGARPLSELREIIENIKYNKKHNIRYIGGTRQETWNKLWNKRRRLSNAVDSIAGRYGIDSDVLKYRLNHEGFTDNLIQDNNDVYRAPYIYRYTSDEDLLNEDALSGFNSFGLDDAADYIDSGKVKLINEQWNSGTGHNEKGRKTNSAEGLTTRDNIGIVAAHLKYFKDLAKTKHPNYSSDELNRASLIYYNRGETGGEKYINSSSNNPNEYNYKRRLESAGKMSK